MITLLSSKILHLLSQIEDEVRESIRSFFSENDELLLQMATVTSEDSNIFVRVAYKPTQKLAFSGSSRPMKRS